MNLNQIQGNIIGFNKKHQHFFFLHFRGARKETKAWLHRMAGEVTSAEKVLTYRENRNKPEQRVDEPWLNLAFTYVGLAALSEILGDGLLTGFPQEFIDGMAKRANVLGDLDGSAPENWTFPKTNRLPVHALLILAANDEDLAKEGVADFTELVENWDAGLRAAGITPVDGQGGQDDLAGARGRDHFGFKDGISQPAFKHDAVQGRDKAERGEDLIWPGEFVLGYHRQDPNAAPDDEEALLAPITPSPAWTQDGSYLVFRRLRQHAEEFQAFLKQESKALGLSEELLRAKLIGRYRSGAPLAALNDQQIAAANATNDDPGKLDENLVKGERANKFSYQEDDPAGNRVPRGAHIRRLNPRDQAFPGKSFVQTRRILRRGIAYGNPDDADRGLLFICYQSSIANQFEFLQRSWANDSYFPPAGAGSIRPGRDPFAVKGPAKRQFHLPLPVSAGSQVTLNRWVTMTGGDYFFSPSKQAISKLADGKILAPDERGRAEAEQAQAKAELDRAAAIARKRKLAEPERDRGDTEEFGRRRDAAKVVSADRVQAQVNLEAAQKDLGEARVNLEAAERRLEDVQATERSQAAAIESAPKFEAAEDELDAAQQRLGRAEQAMPQGDAEHELDGAEHAMRMQARGDAEHELAEAQKAVKVAQVNQRLALGLTAAPPPIPPLPNTIRGGGDCKVQITVAFNGLDPDFYYPWRVWVGGEPVWASQRSEYLAAGSDGFASGTMWLRTPRLVEALDPDMTAGEIVESGWRNEPPSMVVGAYLRWEVEVIIRTEAPGGGVKALRKGSPSSASGARRVATVWADERIGEFFPIDMGLWPA